VVAQIDLWRAGPPSGAGSQHRPFRPPPIAATAGPSLPRRPAEGGAPRSRIAVFVACRYADQDRSIDFERVQHVGQVEVVALVRSEVSAGFVAATLATHGIHSASVECFGYPSVDFVQGIRVTVTAEQAADAREVLRVLGGVPPDEVAD
jgi:hypothetical protein